MHNEDFTSAPPISDGTGNSAAHEHNDGHTQAHGHSHTHTHEHSHSHTHDPAKMRAIINRLSRSIGHLESCRRMLEDGRDCSDVLIQLSAVRSEINNAGKQLLKEHMDHCIVEALAENDSDALTRLNKAIDMFMK